MEYIWTTWHHDLDDEPSEVYSELDENRLEVRKVEFFKGGLCFSYGEERGSFEALSREPFPTDLRSLNLDGEREVKSISRRFFEEIWNQAQERPDGFMGMFLMGTLYLAGGCFWGMERLYRTLPGVTAVTSGYANGDAACHADYESVCTGVTGFRETVRVDYDPGRISLEGLLFAFFAVIDPEMPNRQGMDFGSQYQTGIYWTDPADEAAVRKITALEAAGRPCFAVEQKPLKNFYPAEEYHQRYLEKHPNGYCHVAPERIGALARYPFSSLRYDRRARALLDIWRAESKEQAE